MKRTAIIIISQCWEFRPEFCTKQAGGFQTRPAGQAAAPAGKRPPQAKTQPEFEAYKAARGDYGSAAQEKAADDFAAKFPDSELRPLLYKAVMHSYQQANTRTRYGHVAESSEL